VPRYGSAALIAAGSPSLPLSVDVFLNYSTSHRSVDFCAAMDTRRTGCAGNSERQDTGVDGKRRSGREGGVRRLRVKKGAAYAAGANIPGAFIGFILIASPGY